MKEPIDIGGKREEKPSAIPSILDEAQKYGQHLAQMKVPFILIIPAPDGLFMTSSIIGDVRVGVLERVKHMCLQEMTKAPVEVRDIPNGPEGTC